VIISGKILKSVILIKGLCKHLHVICNILQVACSPVTGFSND
tara:strand:+ start:1007 stop:1132 length:126 start_codon:yes stop_codon:yes gene_type:complete